MRKPTYPNSQAKSKALLLQEGGKRVSINLPARVAQRIAYRKEREGGTTTSIILNALRRI